MAQNLCVVCKKPEEKPTRFGADYNVQADSGTQLTFWMCNDCAIPLGPPQGPINYPKSALR